MEKGRTGSGERRPEEFIRQKRRPQRAARPIVFAVGLVFVTGGYLFSSVLRTVGIIDLSGLLVLNTVFISILMQALPFMLIGVVVSSAMHVFVPDGYIVKIFPQKHGLGFLTAMLAGVFFPVCECAIVPVMERLVRKGVAMPVAVTFMLSAPIVNPIVIVSTLYAFPGRPEIALIRVVLGLVIALAAGLLLSVYGGGLPTLSRAHDGLCPREEDHGHECGCSHGRHPLKEGTQARLRAMFVHAGDEFFSVGKYLIAGAFITSLIQVLVPRSVFAGLGEQNGLSLMVMMALAFFFSACSTSDAFIARSFLNRFSTGAVMGFMVFGPMMDVKNILMLLSGFKKSFVVRLFIIITVLNFLFLYFFAFLIP